MKRIAVRELVDGDHIYKVRAIELESGKVIKHYPLTEELPQTEWLPVKMRLLTDGRLIELKE